MNRKLIINCDDFGQSAAMNEAIMHLLEEGKVSSATIMAAAPGFAEAATWSARRGQPNIGLHLTLTSEFEALPWGSLTGDISLQDESGRMHKTVREFEQKARTRAVAKELDAQYERVQKAGITISHIDNHMGSLYGIATGRSLLPLMFWKASRWKVPARFFRCIVPDDPLLSSLSGIERPVSRASALADALGVPIPDYLLSHPFDLQAGEMYDSFKQSIIGKLYRLPSGVSEMYFHPGREDAWMMEHIPDWQKRVWEFRLLFDDDLAYAMQDARVEMVDYRYVRKKLRRPRIRSGIKLVRELARK
ncbi:polysaccharide deacetylase family protein [Paenibacillus woosongensis]|uniref:ChbG/HpnK family deacetylase n=1 Tax=Paenibacillus woosongensis TaxID=307580 RepID=A0ABQ4MQS2_9BACL|nr:polysaccharide deacetylase family protein [Paenibacillus woosongensis]GIP58301.1 hypothetical protein J15TS10_21150 [Paenibacillus woosongensis]